MTKMAACLAMLIALVLVDWTRKTPYFPIHTRLLFLWQTSRWLTAQTLPDISLSLVTKMVEGDHIAT